MEDVMAMVERSFSSSKKAPRTSPLRLDLMPKFCWFKYSPIFNLCANLEYIFEGSDRWSYDKKDMDKAIMAYKIF